MHMWKILKNECKILNNECLFDTDIDAYYIKILIIRY